MRYLLMALGMWFGLETVFVAILVVVSAIEGHQEKRQADVTNIVGAQEHRAASA